MATASPVQMPIGLTAVEAARRLAESGGNVLPQPRPPGFATLAFRHLRAPLAMVLSGAAAVGLLLGRIAEGAAILVIVVLNSAVGAMQEFRAAGAITALRLLTAPSAVVRREGLNRRIPAAEVVVGDIVVLTAGDRVSADAELLEAESMAVDEALLTGESVPVDKLDSEHVYMGTLVTRGSAVAVVTGIGVSSRLGKLARSLETDTTPPVEAELGRVASYSAALALVLGVLISIVSYARSAGDDDRLASAMVAGIALAVAAVPEGLAPVVTSALALGGQRMARRGAIVRRLSAIETLGSATVICCDKTGTLTTGNLVVADSYAVAEIASLAVAALRCNDAHDGIGDPVDVALAEWAGSLGAVPPGERLATEPFDARTRQMSVVHRTEVGYVVTAKGAPEAVLARCRPSAHLEDVQARADEFAASGLRVLAFAELAVGSAIEPPFDADDAGLALGSGGLQLLGLVGFHDALRPSSAEAVAACRRAGIRVVMVTGDHAVTARAIATSAGLDTNVVVTGDDLASLDPAKRMVRLREAGVVARVEPELKVELVAAHRAAGAIVAMTGDGVNDAPALRAADIGVAISGGSDVAREAAGLVITDGDLGRIVDAVGEGRTIRRNLRSVINYLLAGNLSEILVVVCALILFPELATPLLAVQLLWINLVTDGLPAIALGVDRPARPPMLEVPRAPGTALLDRSGMVTIVTRAVIAGGCVLATGLLAQHYGATPGEIRSQLFLSLLICHLALALLSRTQRSAFETGWWRSPAVLCAIVGSALLQAPAFFWSPLRAALDLDPLPGRAWFAAVAAAAAVLVVSDGVRAAVRRVAGR